MSRRSKKPEIQKSDPSGKSPGIEPGAQLSVNIDIDRILKLVPYPDLEYLLKSEKVKHPVRVLVEELTSGADDSPGTLEVLRKMRAKTGVNYDELLNSLAMGAIYDKPTTKRFAATRLDPDVYEVKDCGGRGRLFVCYDDDTGRTVVVTGHYLKQRPGAAEERRLQDKAIRRAREAMRRWQEAEPLERDRDVRVLRRRKGA